jgi:hypothetical protein
MTKRAGLTALVVGALVLAGCGSRAGSSQSTPTPRATFKIPRAAAAQRGRPLSYAVYDHIVGAVDFDHENADLARMTQGQRALYALASVDGEIQNGGFSQLFVNSTGSLVDEAIDGARLFGARTYERLLRRGGRLFPERRVPEDFERRNRELEAISEAALTGLDDAWFAASEREPLDRYYERYIRRHPSEFFRGET